MIPKIIHYCWFGKNDLPDMAIKCIESWKKHCPDYEIKRWDESNYDISKNQYVKEAYEAKMWAFVSDFVRLDIIYNCGGIYLDTDVEIIHSIDSLLAYPCFLATETGGSVATGLGFGAVKNSPVIKKMLQEYDNKHFLLSFGEYDKTPCPRRNTAPFLDRGYKYTDKIWKTEDVVIFPSEYFCPIDYVTKKTNITDHTFAIHHYSGLWISNEERQLNKDIDLMEKENNRIIAFFKRQKMKYDYSVRNGIVKNWFGFLLRKIFLKIYYFNKK